MVSYALARVRHLSSAFLTWWLSELKEMVPDRLVRLLAPAADELVLEPVQSRLVVSHRERGAVRELGTIDLDPLDPEPARAAMRPLLANIDLHKTRIALRLPADRALRKVINLPAAAEENLREILSFEMDRLTPFSADQVYYDARLLDRDPEARRIKAELTLLPRGQVDPMVEMLRRIGLEPEAVALPRGTDSRKPPWRVPLATNGVGKKRIRRLPLMLLVLTALFLAAAIVITFQRDSRRLEELEREVAVARKDADEARRLEEEITRLESQGNFIVDRKRARPPVVEVLSELTRSLPDTTWLYRLRLIDEELQTFGYSPGASALIGLIESSNLFSNAQFRAPLTRDQRLDAEQFHIAFQVKREGPP